MFHDGALGDAIQHGGETCMPISYPPGEDIHVNDELGLLSRSRSKLQCSPRRETMKMRTDCALASLGVTSL